MTAQAPSLTEALATHLLRPVDASAHQRAAALVADWLGCALGGLRSPLAAQLAALVATLPGGEATALGAGRRDPASALLINAALGNVLEMDDVHRGAILHAGPVVIPVALAAAESADATPQQFLDAVVRGYEATIRIGRALGRGHYRYWHPTSTAGAFGAATAAASILGLDADALADALGTAGSRTGGLWQMRHEPVPTKSIHNAEAARSGLLAAQLAAAGLRGPRRILEGEQGLFAATAPDAQPDLVLADAPDWLIHSTSLKPWPACRHAHPAIDAMRDALRQAGGLPVEAFVSIHVTTYAEALRFCDRPEPTTELEAKFSLQHAVAAIACLGRPELAHYLPATIEDPVVAAMRERVIVSEDEAASARFPDHYGASVTVALADGRRLHAARVDAWGDPECPMPEAAIASKALALAEWGGVSKQAATRVFDAVRELPTALSLQPLQAALAGLDA
ncbi:MmgE/PrpD family protein [Novilysobacter avium]|uniref:MmgE/PrpD family protein n=1 Tax=Novilysobacter avium TaxID=2781023 RepID=A0A7S6UKK6_9GAMM|nr:MmgE/PrpD family protein [Lysobacter avium]QOW22016.1 MmgE/PrpD family protein [Lysobacter avium]